MVPINKTEKDLLVKAFPPHKYPHYYCYPRTMKQDSKLLAKLNEIRCMNVIEEHK